MGVRVWLKGEWTVVLHDTLERAKHREFEPKRQQWLQKSSSQKGTGWEGYKGIGQGKGKGHSGKGSYQRQTKGTGHWGSNQPYWQQSQNDQYYWNQRHQQYQRSYPGGSAGKGYGGSSSSSHGGYHSKGRSERPREEAVEWHGAMYTKYTYSDGRVQWMAWWNCWLRCIAISDHLSIVIKNCFEMFRTILSSLFKSMNVSLTFRMWLFCFTSFDWLECGTAIIVCIWIFRLV